MSPFGGPHLLRFTTSTHDEQGYLTKSPAKVARLNKHLVEKIDKHRDEIEIVRTDLQPGAETLLISYGITAQAMHEAVREARAAGQQVSALTLLSLWPFPERAIKDVISPSPSRGAGGGHAEAFSEGRGIRRVVVAELNEGQVRREIERLVCDGVEVASVHRLDGELITPQQIMEKGELL
jgi:2-oxoglutarate ferredoxin oxidoreductase subunit alpha